MSKIQFGHEPARCVRADFDAKVEGVLWDTGDGATMTLRFPLDAEHHDNMVDLIGACVSVVIDARRRKP